MSTRASNQCTASTIRDSLDHNKRQAAPTANHRSSILVKSKTIATRRIALQNSHTAMVLSDLALRRWKLATYVITGATLWQLVFYEEYHIPGYEGKHVFTDIQKAYRGWVDQKIWGRQALPPPQPPSEAENKRANHDSK